MASIDIRLTGPTKEDVQAQIKTYYACYHPAGYGTSISEPRPALKADGTPMWLAEGWRMSSCD